MEHPLSPFMFPTWYRFQITSVLSILHRFTGIALAVGSILLAWWLDRIRPRVSRWDLDDAPDDEDDHHDEHDGIVLDRPED